VTQIIYSRYEYPIDNSVTLSSLYDKFKHQSIQNADGITIGGFDICVRASVDRAAIFLTYDDESDTYLKLALMGQQGLLYKRIQRRG
jgi:hypothetical protein